MLEVLLGCNMRTLKPTKSTSLGAIRGTLTIKKSNLNGTFCLPPSKSHAMRWIILASMSKTPTRIEMTEIGRDVNALLKCLNQLGIGYENGIITGGELVEPSGPLNCENSGTAFRFLLAQSATCDFTVTLDGDESLRVRSSLPLVQALGVSTSVNSSNLFAPISIEGEFEKKEIEVDVSKSSQFLSSILLMTPRTNGFSLITKGAPVSRKHSQLTWDLCQATGAKKQGEPWEVVCPEVVIPSDASMMAFAKLAGLDVENQPLVNDAIGHDVWNQTGEFDLTDANDLITPLAAYLALGSGGKIIGAKHATFKESNRIKCTASLLSDFGLDVETTEDGLIIKGGQNPTSPIEIVNTFGDHRIQMTAILLAARVGATIDNSTLHEIAWPSYLQQLENLGLQFELN